MEYSDDDEDEDVDGPDGEHKDDGEGEGDEDGTAEWGEEGEPAPETGTVYAAVGVPVGNKEPPNVWDLILW